MKKFAIGSLASEFAANDPYRAATHNKGIMNGVDAVAIATGNDWRAIEAAAHVYASGDTGYQSLSTWSVDSQGNLVGRLEMPLKVGIVGGSLQSNPAVKDLLAVLNMQSARELAEVMGAVGLGAEFCSTAGTGDRGDSTRSHDASCPQCCRCGRRQAGSDRYYCRKTD